MNKYKSIYYYVWNFNQKQVKDELLNDIHNDNQLLNWLFIQLQWQGGTVWQVLQEIYRLQKLLKR